MVLVPNSTPEERRTRAALRTSRRARRMRPRIRCRCVQRAVEVGARRARRWMSISRAIAQPDRRPRRPQRDRTTGARFAWVRSRSRRRAAARCGWAIVAHLRWHRVLLAGQGIGGAFVRGRGRRRFLNVHINVDIKRRARGHGDARASSCGRVHCRAIAATAASFFSCEDARREVCWPARLQRRDRAVVGLRSSRCCLLPGVLWQLQLPVHRHRRAGSIDQQGLLRFRSSRRSSS